MASPIGLPTTFKNATYGEDLQQTPSLKSEAKFSNVCQVRDVFAIITSTLHVHAQSNSDSINTYFLVATDVLMQSLLLLKLLIVTFLEEDRGSLQPK